MLRAIARLPNPPTYLTSLSGPCASAYVITVGTPILRPSLQPNLEYVRSATAEVAKVLRKGDLVILRSTVPVGTTRTVVLPMLEEVSGLKVGQDFDLAFCPERTVEGRALRELRELPQIVGGFDVAGAERAARLFRRSTQTIIDVGSIESAEMLKIMDNTYRDVMFSYANQMALLCEALGLDLVPLVRAANQGYNRNSIPVPGRGRTRGRGRGGARGQGGASGPGRAA
jgi:nucleotide sugar dehydrogenase